MNIIKYTFFTYTCVFISGFSGGTSGKQPVCPCRRHKRCEFNPWVGRIPWKRAWWPTPIFLPGESHGQRSLVGYSPWGHRVEHDWSDLACTHVWLFHWDKFLEVKLLLPNSKNILLHIVTTAAKSLQSCPTLCDPIDGSPPGSPVPGILQARTLEWVAISFSNAWKWKVKGKLLSSVRPSATPWTAAYQAPPFIWHKLIYKVSIL